MNLDTDEALKIHIEGLQSTLGKRNARIRELEAKLAQPVDLDEVTAKLVQKAFNDGWKACAVLLMEATKTAAINLTKVRKDAFDIYMKGEAGEYVKPIVVTEKAKTTFPLETFEGSAYCVKCKEVIEFVGNIKVSDSGRRMAQGNCPRCGTKVNRILGKES